jgi:hypothetical protein
MKQSEKPTQWLIIEATTNSEWDTCSFVLMNLDNANIRTLKERSQLAKAHKDNFDFYNLSFWGNPYGWYQYQEACDDMMEKLSNAEITWAFVTFDNESEIETFTKPEQRIDGGLIQFFKDGNARFVGWGKHTGEEFWTSDFPLEALEEVEDAPAL